MFRKLKLKTKIIVSILISSLLLFILIVVTLNFYLAKNLTNQEIKNISKLNTEQVHESTQIFKNNQTFAKMLGTRTRVKEYLLTPTEARRVELLGIFNDYSKEDTKYLSLYLLDKNGIAIISTDPTFVGQDYSFRSYYKEGMKGQQSVDILLGKTSNQFGYYFSYPVFDDNKNVLGVFVSKINNEEIDDAILKSEASKNNGIMVVDRYGVVVISNKPERFLKSLGELTYDENIEINESKKFLGKDILPLQYNRIQELIRKGEQVDGFKMNDIEDGEIEIIGVKKIGEFPFYLVSETGLDKINGSIMTIIWILLGLIIIVIFFISFTLYKLIMVALLPLKELKLVAENISMGDFSQKIDITVEDEIGDLAKTFNKMSDNLDDLYKNLETKVKERTQKLEESESILKQSLNETERLNKIMIGRELEMIKLKKEIVELKNNK
ncbi:MAG: cache domain-containing protein [Candidatus Paceibacterota bacterium]